MTGLAQPGRWSLKVGALVILVAGACGGGDDPEPVAPPETSASPVASAGASPSTAATTSPAPSAAGATLIEDTFESPESSAFFTDEGKDYAVRLEEGRMTFQIIAAGLNETNVIRTTADFETSADAVRVEADFEFEGGYTSDQGVGAFGIRCFSGDDYYEFSIRLDGEVVIYKNEGGDFTRLLDGQAPGAGTAEGALGPDVGARLGGDCLGQEAGGATDLVFYIDGVEALRHTDDEGLNGFDKMGIGGELTDEKTQGTGVNNDFNFTVDNALATAI